MNNHHMGQHITLPDADIIYYPNVFEPQISTSLFNRLQDSIQWTSRSIKMFGKQRPMPRLLAWYADPNIEYKYSGGTSAHNHWTTELLQIKKVAEDLANTTFNGALLNLYRDGHDSMSWHTDNETSLGPKPVIASVSFGARRDFKMRHKNRVHPTHKIALEDGSVLLMRGTTQDFWQHQLPKTRDNVGPRINITLRKIVTTEELTNRDDG